MEPLDALDLGFVDKGLLENLGMNLWQKGAILAETSHRESTRRYVENFIRTIKNRISADNGDDIFHWQRISKILKMLYLHDSKFRIDRHEELMRINMELVSRLAFRLKDDQLRALAEMLIDIYEHSNLVRRDRSLMQELNLLFERVFQAFKPAMMLEFIEKFAQLGLNSISTIPVVYKEYWPEPMSHMININAKFAKKHVPEEWLPKFTHIIDILLQKLLDDDNDIRQRASIRLLFFYELGAMSKEQRDAYAKNLWNKVDSETRLPGDTGMYPEQLLRMLINIEPDKEGLLEKYVSEHDFGEKGDLLNLILSTETLV